MNVHITSIQYSLSIVRHLPRLARHGSSLRLTCEQDGRPCLCQNDHTRTLATLMIRLPAAGDAACLRPSSRSFEMITEEPAGAGGDEGWADGVWGCGVGVDRVQWCSRMCLAARGRRGRGSGGLWGVERGRVGPARGPPSSSKRCCRRYSTQSDAHCRLIPLIICCGAACMSL